MVIALVDFELPSAKEFFVKSIHETGFSVIKNHGIDKKLIEKVFKQWEVFFYLL